jgi:hypothetical protein
LKSGTPVRLRDAAVWILPGGAAVFLYFGCVGFWWSGDELIYLKSVALHAPWRYLFVPVVYRELSPVLFFPGVLLSFDFDHRIFGLDVSLYYLHQLLALALAASLVSLLARRFLRPAPAIATGLLFLLGPPLPVVVSELMSRHYIEGLAAALAATFFFLRFIETRRRLSLLGAAALWLFAAACKEIFVPLPFVLVFLPVGKFRERLRAAWPFGTGLVLYAVWRQTMLAGAFGGYEASSERIGLIGGRLVLVARQFAAVTILPYGTAGRLLACSLILLALLAVVRVRSLAFMAALTAAVAGPLLPVAERTEARLELLPWLLIAFLGGCAFARSRSASRPWQALGAAAVLCAFALRFPANRSTWSDVTRTNQRIRAEGEFFLARSEPEDVLRQPLGVTTYFGNLRWLRREVLGRGEAGLVAYDDAFFCKSEGARLRVQAFSAPSGKVEPLSSDGGSICRELTARIREAPLTVQLSYEDPFISWKLGPYVDGRYALIHGVDDALFPAGPDGSVRYHIDDLTLRVKYESPEGWLAYSPPLRLQSRMGRAYVDWSRERDARLKDRNR